MLFPWYIFCIRGFNGNGSGNKIYVQHAFIYVHALYIFRVESNCFSNARSHARTHTTHSYVACLVGARKAGDHFVIICVNDVPFSPFQWEILLVFKMLTFLWYKTHSITLGSLSFHGVLFWSATWITISWLVCSSMQCVEFHVCYSTSEIHESENLSENKFDRLLFQISKLHWCAYLCMYSEAWTPL